MVTPLPILMFFEIYRPDIVCVDTESIPDNPDLLIAEEAFNGEYSR